MVSDRPNGAATTANEGNRNEYDQDEIELLQYMHYNVSAEHTKT